MSLITGWQGYQGRQGGEGEQSPTGLFCDSIAEEGTDNLEDVEGVEAVSDGVNGTDVVNKKQGQATTTMTARRRRK